MLKMIALKDILKDVGSRLEKKLYFTLVPYKRMFVCANKVQINISIDQNLLFFYFSLDYFNFFSFLKHNSQVQISTNCYQPKTVYFIYLSIIYPNINKNRARQVQGNK